MTWLRLTLCALLMAFLAACGGDNTRPADGDGGNDAGVDAQGDDGGSDGGGDGMNDGGADGGWDGGLDGGFDGGLDGGSDGGADQGPTEIPFQTGVEITTTSGDMLGKQDGDLRVFKGIPYAEPPVGDRRLRAPEPVDPWDGVFSADEFGPSCLQSLALNPNGTSEDCLTLNVWAHLDDEPRPVMVWIYGGGFIMGETAMATYDGADLASDADVVVVSINYRLGVLGNLALPELRDEDPLGSVGNMGLLDQIEALRWVEANAAAFGGDGDNITVLGESAGAISACALLGSPLADDLFHKAILQSGNCALFSSADVSGLPLAGSLSALEFGERVVADLGCSQASDRLVCLRGLPAEDLANALDLTALFEVFQTDVPLGWTIDGVVLPQLPYSRIVAGEAPSRPLIAGSNGNEASIFTIAETILTRADFRDKIAPLFGGQTVAEQVVDLYSVFSYPLAKDAFTAFVGEWMFNCNTYHTVRSLDGSGYYYELLVGPTVTMTPFGPSHGADLFYVLGNFLESGIVPTVIDLDVERQVQAAWGAFARTGVPSWEGGWPPARQDNPEHLSIEWFSSVKDDFRSGRCDALRDLGVLP